MDSDGGANRNPYARENYSYASGHMPQAATVAPPTAPASAYDGGGGGGARASLEGLPRRARKRELHGWRPHHAVHLRKELVHH